MADVKYLRAIVSGIPTTIDLTAAGTVLTAENFKLTAAAVTASKPLKLDADKKLTSGDIDLTSEITGVLPVANGGTNSSSALNNNRIMISSGDAIVEQAAQTANRAVISDANGLPTAHASVTNTEVGYLQGVTSSIQDQINGLAAGYSRRKVVKSIIADNTVQPPTEVSGDRYILSVDGGAPHADWDGASAGDIVEFNGTSWVATSPVEGYVAYSDADNKDALYVDDGTPAWELRPVAVTDHGDLSGLADDDHSQYHTDGRANTWFATKDLADLATKSHTSLTDIGTNTHAQIDTHIGDATKHFAEGDIDHTNIQNIGTNSHAQIDTHIGDGTKHFTMLDEDNMASDSDTQAATQQSIKAYVDNAVAGAAPDAVDFEAVAGEAMAANTTFAVRRAVSGETAGRVYKATSDEENSPGKYRVIGFVQTTDAVSEGGTVTVKKFVKDIALKSADSVVGSAATDNGKYLYLNKAGGFSLDPATGITTGEKYAVVLLGILNEYNATNTSEKILMDVGVGGFQGIDLGP